MRILVVAPDVPFPPLGGGQLRTHYLLRALAAHHDLTLVAFDWGRAAAVPPFPVRVVEVPWEKPRLFQEMLGEDATAARSAFAKLTHETDEPFLVGFYQSAAMEQALERVTRTAFDLIVIENTFMARFLPALPPDVPKVLDLQNVLALIAQRQEESASAEEKVKADFVRTRRFEQWAAGQCVLCVTTSDREAAAARGLLRPGRVEVVPNGVDTTFFTPGPGPAARDQLLFTGSMLYWPNVEAVQYFTAAVLPLVRRGLPGATLHIVGADPTDEVKRLDSERVVVHGAVPDMRPYFRQAALVVVPLLHGGGTRLKILEAAASGKAVVSTSLGAEGLEFRPGEDLLLADTAEEFAGAVIRLARDDARRRRVEENARAASLPYDWERIGPRFRHLVESLC